MSTITAAQVKELRDATSVSMMECKKALTETQGDFEAATKLLRERGVATAAKRADKAANQGQVAAAATDDGKVMAMVEVNCETDFVARNADFQAFVADVAARALETDEDLNQAMHDTLMDKIAAIGENMKIRRAVRYVAEGTGQLASYIHMGGKVGVLIDVGCEKAETVDHAAFQELVKDLTLHVAAAAPRYLTSDEIPEDVLAEERAIFAKQVEGKPANIIDKIVDGKMRKFYEETCLVNQGFVKEPKQSITDLVTHVSQQVGASITIRRFARYQLGQ